eukprot:1153090-Pelagomonas_calceolata.AAC.4
MLIANHSSRLGNARGGRWNQTTGCACSGAAPPGGLASADKDACKLCVQRYWPHYITCSCWKEGVRSGCSTLWASSHHRHKRKGTGKSTLATGRTSQAQEKGRSLHEIDLRWGKGRIAASPASSAIGCRYADRAKEIKTHVVQNVGTVESHIADYQRMIDALQDMNENIEERINLQKAVFEIEDANLFNRYELKQLEEFLSAVTAKEEGLTKGEAVNGVLGRRGRKWGLRQGKARNEAQMWAQTLGYYRLRV